MDGSSSARDEKNGSRAGDDAQQSNQA